MRLIDADALTADFTNECIGECDICPHELYNEEGFCALIVNAPTIEAVPVENIKRIVERLEEVAKDYVYSSYLYEQGKFFAYSNAADIVKKEGGL